MKKILSVLLLVVLLTALLGGTAYADSSIVVLPGDTMPDFTVSLTDGSTATLSDLLKENDLVVLNLFASWCGPCKGEFPEMEAVYEAYRDQMEIVAVSPYYEDTMEIISEYKGSHGLTFPMGLADDGLKAVDIPGYPTTFFIDRSGMVGMINVGAFQSREEFENDVNYFLSDDYDGQPIGFEEVFNPTPYLLGFLPISGLVLTIGRWGILRKAGKKGWLSLIPLVNVYQEYSTVWNGWLGVLADLCVPIGAFCIASGLPVFLYYALAVLSLVLGVMEGLKLAKAFGKGKFFGILHLILGVGKSQFQPVEA